jgi:hypothetical protein
MDKEGDRIRRLMAVPPHPESAGRERPTEEQLRALEQSLLQAGFHPSVAQEQLITAQLLGVDSAIDSIERLNRSYPYDDGVSGTAARSSRQDYFEDLGFRRGMRDQHQYPERMKKIPQKGTSESYGTRQYKRGAR